MKIVGRCLLFLLPSLSFGDALVLKNGQTIYGTCIVGYSITNLLLGASGLPSTPKIGWILFKTQSGVEQRFDIEGIRELKLDGNSLFALFGREAQDKKKMVLNQNPAELARDQVDEKFNNLSNQLNDNWSAQEKTSGIVSPLVGTWVFESQAYQTYEHGVLTLNANGTYTRTLKLRAFGPGSGTFGGTDQGTWTANGSVVTVSGDGYLNAKAYDLKEFTRAR